VKGLTTAHLAELRNLAEALNSMLQATPPESKSPEK
jgi:hypothetical protein